MTKPNITSAVAHGLCGWYPPEIVYGVDLAIEESEYILNSGNLELLSPLFSLPSDTEVEMVMNIGGDSGHHSIETIGEVINEMFKLERMEYHVDFFLEGVYSF